MRQQGFRTIWLLLGLFWIATSTGQAQSTATQEQVPPPQAALPPLSEYWDAIYLQGTHVGYSHGVYRPLRGNLIQSNEEFHLALTRFNQLMKMDFSFGMVENPAGKIQQFHIRQSMGRDDELVRVGVVDQATVKIAKTQGNQPVVTKNEPWNDEALGLYAMEQLYRKRELKPGLEFDFKTFSPEFNSVVNYHVTVGEQQPTELLGGRKLPFWRIVVKLQKIAELQLDPMICWVNEKGEVFKREQTVPGLGDLTFYRTRKERAIPTGNAVIVNPGLDIGFSQLIRVNRAFNHFNQTKSVQYRVKLKDFNDIATAFATDARQEVKVINKEELDIISRRQQPPPSGATTNAKLPAEYLRSSHFINTDDALVQRHARAATGTERDPWQKALLIETYVHRKMKNNDYGKAFATAAETAKTLDGDCSEHSVLATAMCRAAGIPSRTAIGLIHVPSERAMCFHMWFEVWIDGKWYSLDATLGQGHIAGGHVKVIDAHWNDMDSFLPLLPVSRLLGKLKMDVLSVEYEANVPPR